jgi:hypothetical protein
MPRTGPLGACPSAGGGDAGAGSGLDAQPATIIAMAMALADTCFMSFFPCIIPQPYRLLTDEILQGDPF